MTTDTIYEERGSHWAQQVSTMVATRWLQHDQTFPFLVKCVACETSPFCEASGSYLGSHELNPFLRKKN